MHLEKKKNSPKFSICFYDQYVRTGERMPSISIIVLSDYFSVSIDWLRQDGEQTTTNKDHVPLGRTVKIPIIKTAITETQLIQFKI